MGGVWSVINSMVGVDDRDLQLTATMIRAHHAAIVQARATGTAVPWQRMWHQTAPNVPYQTEWGMMGHILESAPLPDYVALATEGVEGKLDDIEAFQSDPTSAHRQHVRYCDICRQIAYDEGDVDLWDGPIGTDRFFANWGRRLENRWVWNDQNGRNTGVGRNRRMEAQ